MTEQKKFVVNYCKDWWINLINAIDPERHVANNALIAVHKVWS